METNNDKSKEIENKAKELARLIFLKLKNINQVCITVIEEKKLKDFGQKHKGYNVKGICFKKEDIIKKQNSPEITTKTKQINKEKLNKQS